MKVTPIKTNIVHVGDDFFALLDKFVPKNLENKVLVVTSKVLSMCEKNVVKPSNKFNNSQLEKQEIAKAIVDKYLSPHSSKYNLMITIIHNTILINGGIDSSNSQGYYVLLPKDPYKWAKNIWQYLKTKHNLSNFGVVISDSKSFPLKWGRVGTAISYCGFKALNNKIGKEDLFGKKIEMTHVAVAEGIAVAAVLEMGETNEAQPLCLVEDVKQLEFVAHPPTKKEINFLNIDLQDDAYAPFLVAADWKQSKKIFKNYE